MSKVLDDMVQDCFRFLEPFRGHPPGIRCRSYNRQRVLSGVENDSVAKFSHRELRQSGSRKEPHEIL